MRGKWHLKSLEKYYIVDVGLCRLLLGDHHRDIGHILENIIYLELICLCVQRGKVGELEIDFIAEKNSNRTYYQVLPVYLTRIRSTKK